LTNKEGVPLSVVISSASTHDINLVTNVVDNVVIRRRIRRRRKRPLRQHLCPDKGYNSIQEEHELIKRGYVLHIPIKKKKGSADCEAEVKEAKPKHKKYSSKRWVVERTNSWHNRFRKLFTRYEKR